MSSVDRRKVQNLTLLVVGVVVLAVLMGILLLMPSNDQSVAAARSQPEVDLTLINDRSRGVSPEQSWLTLGEDRLEGVEDEIDQVVKSHERETREVRAELDAYRNDMEDVVVQLMQKIEGLEQRAQDAEEELAVVSRRPSILADPAASAGTETTTPAAFQTGTQPFVPGAGSDFIDRRSIERPPLGGRAGQGATPAAAAGPSTFGQSFTLSARADADETEEETLGLYVPAGTYAGAVVLSGADASTNVSSREDPKPVLFRISDKAVGPAERTGRPTKYDLRGCIVVGSATGDLSSERVEIRLIKMTCQFGGRPREVEVSGYAAGSGKLGVRGKVVSREGPILRNAGIAGALEGLASASGEQSESVNVGGVDFATGASDSMAGAAVSGAASRLSEYYIQRAEQYQPVVSMYAGTHVELVFVDGFEL